MSQKLGTAAWIETPEVDRKFGWAGGTDLYLGHSGSGREIGYADDRHVLLVSSNRGGKGTSIIVPARKGSDNGGGRLTQGIGLEYEGRGSAESGVVIRPSDQFKA